MNLFAFHTVDFVVLLLYMLAMVGIGFLFNRQQKTSKDFFLAGRSMSWFPVGVSVMATLLSALSYTGVPGEAYFQGLKYLLLAASAWLTLPFMWSFFLPLYRGLGLYSVYEYLELRFDLKLRILGSLVFVIWRLLWLGGVLYAPCKVLIVATGISIPEWAVLVSLGLVSTAYTFLGGMKAVIWTDVIQSVVMLLGIVFIVGGVCLKLDGGMQSVWSTASELGRTQIAETEFGWNRAWTLWGILPHFVVSMLSFYVADQITAQRFLTARDTKASKRAFVLNCVSVSIMMPLLAFTGMSILAFYQHKPNEMRPIWVANVENRDGKAAESADGQPLLDWQVDGTQLDRNNLSREYLEKLIREQRLLQPNSSVPFAPPRPVDPKAKKTENWKKKRAAERQSDIDEAVRRIAGQSADELRIEELAIKSVAPGSKRGRSEWIINRRAKDELMPRFIRDQLPIGFAGLILAALFAASMSSMDSGLNSITTLIVTDYFRRLGWGREWLATRLGKSPDELNEEDELRLGRPLVLIVGLLATAFSLFIGSWGSIFDIMIGVVNTFGGPLLAVFLLGVFTRRATSASTMLALILGMLGTLWMMLSNRYEAFAWMWPFATKLHSLWNVLFAVGGTFVIGYLGGFLMGRARTKRELEGLVAGIGRLGETGKNEVAINAPRLPEDRWRK